MPPSRAGSNRPNPWETPPHYLWEHPPMPIWADPPHYLWETPPMHLWEPPLHYRRAGISPVRYKYTTPRAVLSSTFYMLCNMFPGKKEREREAVSTWASPYG